jgi:hypothetical protein
MSTPTDPGLIFDARENTAKLPKWVTELIYDLRKALGDWKTYAESARFETDQSGAVMLDYYSSVPVGLPPHEPIYFCDPAQRDRNDRPEALMSARWRNNVLIVDTMNAEPLLIAPSASNVARLAALPRELRNVLWSS